MNMKGMIVNPDEYAGQPNDSVRDAEVLAWLRDQEEWKKFEFIYRVLRLSPGRGLPLVKRAQLKPVHLEVILELGFVYGDASTVRSWYEATVAGLGKKKVVRMVRSHLDDGPLIVDKMLYWLARDMEGAEDEVLGLRDEFSARHPNFKSRISTGIHGLSS